MTRDNLRLTKLSSVLAACSLVFKSIIKDLPHNSSVIYLRRGIQHQEMESILEFMYLGVATFNQERMNEFLNVAKNLEVEIDEKPDISQNENNAPFEQVNEPETNTDRNKISVRNRHISRTTEGMFNCDQCESKFTFKQSLVRHIQSKYEGVKYACNKCEYQATTQGSLTIHIQSKHEGLKYDCSHCEQQFTHQSSLLLHFRSKNEGVKYPCNECNYQATRLDKLKIHVESKHEGVKYTCNQCNHQTTSKHGLELHIIAKHEKTKFPCNQCDNVMNSRSSLLYHKRVKHLL